jgi:hypothetical protein
MPLLRKKRWQLLPTFFTNEQEEEDAFLHNKRWHLLPTFFTNEPGSVFSRLYKPMSFSNQFLG